MNQERTQHVDVLIDRIAANEASADDFRALEAQARRDPVTWERLARALRDELHLRATLQADDHAARAEAEIAAAVDTSPSDPADSHANARRAAPWLPIRAWSGWAAAAVIAMAWLVYQPALPENAGPEQASPGGAGAQLASLTADDAYERYLELGHSEGRVIRELPTRMIELESAEDGDVVVYYIRQLLERERVNEMYQYAEDELGRPLPVPIDISSVSATGSSL